MNKTLIKQYLNASDENVPKLWKSLSEEDKEAVRKIIERPYGETIAIFEKGSCEESMRMVEVEYKHVVDTRISNL